MDEKEYRELLEKVRQKMVSSFSRAVGSFDSAAEENKIRDIIRSVIRETVGMDPTEALVARIFNDTARYGRLTEWLERDDIEEINVNAWDNTVIHFTDGRTEMRKDMFLSPEQAEDVIRKLLRERSGSLLDNSSSIAYAHLGATTRIAAVHSSLLREGSGAAASIRFVHKAKMNRRTLLGTTATEDMLFLLENLFRYGISICISGKTYSGKTNTAGYILNSLPSSCRIVTLEEVIREVDLTHDLEGNERNAVQLTTKESDDASARVTLAELFRASLRLNPSHIFVGEMRSEEAWNAQEASRSDHAVITTIHSKSAESAYLRMVTLAKQAYDFDDAFLLELMAEAFPIVVYQKRLENGRRVLMEVSECTGFDRNRGLSISSLYRFEVTRNSFDAEGNPVVEGHFEQTGTISRKLQSDLRQNGCPADVLKRLTEGGEPLCLVS